MLLRLVLTGLVAASTFRLSNPINPSGTVMPVVPGNTAESDRAEWLDASELPELQEIPLESPSTEYLHQRKHVESLVCDTIPKLKKAAEDVFARLFKDRSSKNAVIQLDREIDNLLNPKKLSTDQLTSAPNLAKLAAHSVYSDRGFQFLDDLLRDIKSEKPNTDIAKKIHKSMMRGKITAWLEEKKHQFYTIHNNSGFKSRAAFIQITSSDHDRSRTPASLADRLTGTHSASGNPTTRFFTHLTTLHAKNQGKRIS
jgi:hypothetical protein